MAESKICGCVVDGQPVQVKVIVDFQRIADKLAKKARGQKNGKASDCHGAVRVEVVPIRAKTQTSGIIVQKRKGDVAIVVSLDEFGRNFMLKHVGDPLPADGKGYRWAIPENQVFDLKCLAAKKMVGYGEKDAPLDSAGDRYHAVSNATGEKI